MYAYTEGEPPTLSSSDGGEGGAGGRLERLLHNVTGPNVVVLVLRWYGGVELGPDRWRCISQVAKEALERGKFRRPTQEKKKGSKKTK